MNQNIPESVLKDYILDHAETYDEYISFRKVFAYQYGAASTINFVLGVQGYLQNYMFELNGGHIYLN